MGGYFLWGTPHLHGEDDCLEILSAEGIDPEVETKVLEKVVLEEFMEQKLSESLEANTPKLVFWKYNEEYLVQREINLEEFAVNPGISIPLRNCFEIAGIDSERIVEEIEGIVGNSTQQSKLKRRLSKKVTEHVNSIWPEHKVKLEFEIDNMKLNLHINDIEQDEDVYHVDQRSDGFKHFISILLNLSVENETGKLKNKIIVLDEPETHLHPSGQKFLRDELLKISKNNLVIYATHSIFMTDKVNLDRHYSVEKEGVATKVEKISTDNPFKQEVLYESLGTSILEHVNENVLVVEGKTDRDVFDIYKKCFAEGLVIPNVSVIPAGAASKVCQYAKFFSTNLVMGYVLVDSDQPGRAELEKLRDEFPKYDSKNSFEIMDLLSAPEDRSFELEDLFDKSVIEDVFLDTFKHNISLDSSASYFQQVTCFCKDNKLYVNKNGFEAKKKDMKLKLVGLLATFDEQRLKSQLYYQVFENLISKIGKL